MEIKIFNPRDRKRLSVVEVFLEWRKNIKNRQETIETLFRKRLKSNLTNK